MSDTPTLLEQLNAIQTIIAMIVSEQRYLMQEKPAGVEKQTPVVPEAPPVEVHSWMESIRESASPKEVEAETPRRAGVPIRTINPALAHLNRSDFSQGGKFYGLMAHIARKLNIGGCYVKEVVDGKSHAARVIAAIIEEIQLGYKPPQKFHDQLSATEEVAFHRGGRYYGLYRRVAQQLGLNKRTVSAACRGTGRSDRAVIAVRAEMARVDAELAAKGGQ
jgi:hypothetical protein